MPIYEFYCRDCHRVYNFLARRLNVETVPACPRCGRPRLEKRLSRFAIGRRRETAADDSAEMPGGDDAAFESLMGELEREAEHLDENDPHQMGRLMRRLCEKTGMPLDGPMAEAIRRLEAGEDPDRIEEQMGDLLDEYSDDALPSEEGNALRGPAGQAGRKVSARDWVRRLKPPDVDDGLYDLD
mgnify:CR=1 FL=1